MGTGKDLQHGSIFSMMYICVLRIEVMVPTHPSLLLHLGTSKLVLFKKPTFDKLFLAKM